MKLDTVYMIVLPDNKGVVYDSVSTKPQDSWRKVIQTEALGTGVTKEMLQRQGYRAKKVIISLAD